MRLRPTIVRQRSDNECGAACLATVALHHGLKVSLREMRKQLRMDHAGTSLRELADAATSLGFEVRGVRASLNDLEGLPLPAIASVRLPSGDGHFVVIHKVKRDSILLADPATGIRRVSRQIFQHEWGGVLLLLIPDDLSRARQEAKSAGPLSLIARIFKQHLPLLAEAFVCGLLMTVMALGTSWFVQLLVDSVLPSGERGLLKALGIGMLAIIVFRALFGALRQYLLAHIGRTLDLTLISGYLRHVLRLPMSFFSTRQTGDILSRVGDANRVRDAIGGAALTIFGDSVLTLVALAALFAYDQGLALLCLAFAVPLVGVGAIFQPMARRSSRAALEASARLSSHLVESLVGIETVKAFGAEELRRDEAEERLVESTEAAFALEKVGMHVSAWSMVASEAAGIVLLWVGAGRVLDGSLTLGQLLFVYTLVGHVLGPLERLVGVHVQVQDALSAMERLQEVLEETPEGEDRTGHRFDRIQGSISLQDVTFAYGEHAPTLSGLDLEIPAGKTTAIVGESGCGKSTLLKLLLGLYDPQSGRVQVDGVDLRDVDLSSYRSRLGVVSQDAALFSGSIADNVELGREDALSAEVLESISDAGLLPFVDSLPERAHTPVGERGSCMSGGQRQRLALARALIRRPEILILDEATSHLDTITEEEIHARLQDHRQNTTAVIVAHRLSTVKDAEIIHVMRAGSITESGSHEELLELGGEYAGLWATQTGASDINDNQTLNDRRMRWTAE